jgi:hypothetical protein
MSEMHKRTPVEVEVMVSMPWGMLSSYAKITLVSHVLSMATNMITGCKEDEDDEPEKWRHQ